MRAFVVAVGDELVEGAGADTNSPFISSVLRSKGFQVVGLRVIPDDRAEIAQTIKEISQKAEVLIITGGLGPTPDDLTREALAQALGTKLTLHEETLASLEAFFAKRGREMPAANRVQALIPEGAEALPNSLGTAPGIFCKLGNCMIFALPGVPSEMRHMLKEEVLPRLPRPGLFLKLRTVHTFGRAESDVAATLGELLDRNARPRVGITASFGVISLRIFAEGKNPEEAQELVTRTESKIRNLLGESVFGFDEETLQEVVGKLLRKNNLSLSVAESCTGGLIGELITSVPGSSDYFQGGVIAYSNEAKKNLLKVPEEILKMHGAVSRETAEAMAKGVREKFSSSWSLSVTGIAGPGGGSEEKPVGLVWIGISGPGGTEAFRHIFPGDRHTVRMRASFCALNHLRLALLHSLSRA